jgi:hypothetical protein
MAGRKIRDGADAVAGLRAVEKSALSLAHWARSAGIDGRSLNAWRMNLGARSRPATLRMVEVTLTPPKPVGRYVDHLGEVAVEVDEYFDGDTLLRLLDVVAEC